VRKAARVGGVAGILALLVLALLGAVNLAVGDRPVPARVRNDAPLSDPAPRFRVAVLGDTQKGLANLSNLLRRLKEEKVDLILHTGDLVSTNDEGHYRLAALYLERAGIDVPMVVVPGNHDLKSDSARFRREIGPLEVAFVRGKAAFFTVDNASGKPPDLERLDRLVASAPEGAAVVLALHVPPFDAAGRTSRACEPFVEWLRKSRVRVLLSGHVHDYVRREIGPVVAIANGVGGDYESWKLKQKVYATVLEIDGTTIRDRAIELPPEHGVIENLEHFAVGHLAQAYRDRPILAWLGTALLAALTGVLIGIARRR
jgi:predicted phosphodiesterase